jgi:hypothetical protein
LRHSCQRVGQDLKTNILKSKANNTTILLDSANQRNKNLLNELCIWKKYMWDNGHRINVKFLNGGLDIQQKIIRFAKEWETHANIEFNFINGNENADIRISLTPNFSSWSYIGKDCLNHSNQSEPTMNFGWFFSITPDDEIKRVTLHEFGHALGCIHEHQHPDGNIPWDSNVVRRIYTTTFHWTEEQVQRNIFDSFPPIELTRSVYDPDSIMHYFFPKEMTVNRIAFKENFELSQSDIDFIKLRYPK